MEDIEVVFVFKDGRDLGGNPDVNKGIRNYIQITTATGYTKRMNVVDKEIVHT